MITPVKYEIAHAGMSIGEHVVNFTFDRSLFDCFAESGIERGEGKISLHVIKHASMLEINASIIGTVETQCDRCADLYTQPIDFQGSVVVKMSEEQGEYDGDIIWVDPRSSIIDLTQWLYESIILSLPLQRVHLAIEQCNAEALKYIKSE